MPDWNTILYHPYHLAGLDLASIIMRSQGFYVFKAKEYLHVLETAEEKKKHSYSKINGNFNIAV